VVARLTLDSGAVSALASGHQRLRADLTILQRRGFEAVVPSPVVTECVTGDGPRDANTNRVLNRLTIVSIDESIARRAGQLRYEAQRQDATVDALIVATAEIAGGGLVFTGDYRDLSQLAQPTSVSVVAVR
jgi:predicted nucleic acid-binding protein